MPIATRAGGTFRQASVEAEDFMEAARLRDLLQSFAFDEEAPGWCGDTRIRIAINNDSY